MKFDKKMAEIGSNRIFLPKISNKTAKAKKTSKMPKNAKIGQECIMRVNPFLS